MPPGNRRRGITLMEVLISIGILAVGLTSVVSLVPAGQSQAAQAVILDRAASTVANALQDAVTFGLTRPDSVSFDSNGGKAVWIFDPVIQRDAGATVLTGDVFPGAAGALLKRTGVYSQSSVKGDPPSWQVLQLLAQGRDDIIVGPGETAEDPPLGRFDGNGIRLFNGRMTCLFSVASSAGDPTASPAAGDVAKLTVVAFHNRSPAASDTYWPATYDGQAGLIRMTALPTGRTLREVLRPGVVIYDSKKPDRTQWWSQLQMASVDSADGKLEAYVTFTTQPPLGGDIRILLDSVGLAEQMVVLEGPGPYSK